MMEFPKECLVCKGAMRSAGTVTVHGSLLYTTWTCVDFHSWDVMPDGEVKIHPKPEPYVPVQAAPIPVFDEWATINQVISPGRSRFDVLREKLPQCKTKSEVHNWVVSEGYGRRYPLIPSELPD